MRKFPMILLALSCLFGAACTKTEKAELGGVSLVELRLELGKRTEAKTAQLAEIIEEQRAAFEAEGGHGGEAEGIGAVGRTGGEDAAALDRTARREHERAPALVAMKPPEQPHAFEAGEVAQGVLVAAVREEFQFVALLGGRRRLVAGLELDLLAGAEKADGLERQR